MFTLIRKQTRSSIEVKFFYEVNPNASILHKHIKANYMDTGKLVSSERVFNNNGLEMIQTSNFRSYDDFKEYIQDKFFENTSFLPQMIHDIEHDITSDVQYIFDGNNK